MFRSSNNKHVQCEDFPTPVSESNHSPSSLWSLRPSEACRYQSVLKPLVQKDKKCGSLKKQTKGESLTLQRSFWAVRLPPTARSLSTLTSHRSAIKFGGGGECFSVCWCVGVFEGGGGVLWLSSVKIKQSPIKLILTCQWSRAGGSPGFSSLGGHACDSCGSWDANCPEWKTLGIYGFSVQTACSEH